MYPKVKVIVAQEAQYYYKKKFENNLITESFEISIDEKTDEQQMQLIKQNEGFIP